MEGVLETILIFQCEESLMTQIYFMGRKNVYKLIKIH